MEQTKDNKPQVIEEEKLQEKRNKSSTNPKITIFLKLVGQDRWTMWRGGIDSVLQEIVQSKYHLTEKLIQKFQLRLNNTRPLDAYGTLQENSVTDASTIIITPRLKGGSSQTSLLNFGFKKKAKNTDN